MLRLYEKAEDASICSQASLAALTRLRYGPRQTTLEAHQSRVGVLCQRTADASAVRVSCQKRMLPPQPSPGRAA